jgi:DNA gyrase/topoisomerase IV subunit A
MRAGLQAIIMKISEDAQQYGNERYSQIKNAIDSDIDAENKVYQEEFNKQREILRRHNKHEYMRRLEYQRSRLNRDLLLYQNGLIDEICEMAVAKLRNASSYEFTVMFKSAVKRLYGSYILHLGELSIGKLDDNAIGDAMKETEGLSISLSSEAIAGKSGFALRNENVEFNNIFEDLIEDVKKNNAAAIIKEVFGSSGDWMFT